MTWYTFTVTPIVHGDLVAAHLLHMANDPSTLRGLKPGAAVFRRKHDNSEQFFVTPAAAALFDPFVRTYGGTPCEPPQTQDLLSLDLSRLRVEERVRWELMASRERPGKAMADEEAGDGMPAFGV
ncbi:MAG TPA: hypothetical protein VFE23_00335 [Usitatibacter sp.]|jgi:hypothetical protein|nr:hypothetical protein [Usitatibacter sp.]